MSSIQRKIYYIAYIVKRIKLGVNDKYQLSFPRRRESIVTQGFHGFPPTRK